MKFKVLKINFFDDEVLEVSSNYFSISSDISRRFDAEINNALDKLEENPFAYFNLNIHPYRRIVLHSFPFAIIYRIEADLVYVLVLFPLKDDPAKLYRKLSQ